MIPTRMVATEPDPLELRRLARAELDLVVDWAAAEGWNPGHADAAVFWETDPHGFVGVHRGGELAAAGAIVSYGGRLGFMGLFIVRPELRGRGLGRRLWFLRRDALLARLRRGAAIGMDGVFAMQDFYAAGGFRLSHRNLRMRGVGERVPADPMLRPLSGSPSPKWPRSIGCSSASSGRRSCAAGSARRRPRPWIGRAWAFARHRGRAAVSAGLQARAAVRRRRVLRGADLLRPRPSGRRGRRVPRCSREQPAGARTRRASSDARGVRLRADVSGHPAARALGADLRVTTFELG